MNCCSHCKEVGEFFNDKTAQKELKQYKKKGPWKSTRLLIDMLRNTGIEGKTLMDVGGGIGAIQHELFENSLKSAIQVDASKPYLSIAEQEAKERGNSDKLTSYYGDFVELAPELPNVDIVTLDRVLCCYPYMEKMVDASASKANQVIGLVYPREGLLTKIGLGLANFFQKIRNKDFRVYLHSREKVDERLNQNGFQLRDSDITFIWHVDVYEKTI